MYGVRRRQVQKCIGICRLQQLPGRLELACAEHSFEQLQLQCRMVGGWRSRMQGVWCRQVQEHGGIRQLRRVPDSLRLAYWWHIDHALHLQFRMVWA